MVFFFQAEDGIRDRNVTGVQTCALPISSKLNLIEVDFPKINNPFYSELFEYLAFYLQDKGYDSILHLDHYQSQDINYYLERFKRKEIAGLITSSPIKIPKKGLKIKFPIVS